MFILNTNIGPNHVDLILNDPIEETDEYKAVINEVEKLVYERFPKEEYPIRGMCHKRWYYKQRLLKERGIDWKTPAEMNPLTTFE